MRELKINAIQSVDKAIDILNALSVEKEWLTINEIMSITGFSKATTYRLLYTMEQRGLIRYDSLNSKYNLGFKLLEYGDSLLASQDILREAEVSLIELYKNTKQTVLLARVDGDSLTYIFKREKVREGLVYSSVVGQKRHLLYGALGRVALAYLPEKQRERILEEPLPEWTSKSVVDKEKLLIELQRVRKDKVCVEFGEAAVGLTGIASPIFDSNGNIIAVLGIVCPSVNLEKKSLEEIEKQVKETAVTISRKMGFELN